MRLLLEAMHLLLLLPGVSVRTSENGYSRTCFFNGVMSVMSHFLRYLRSGPGRFEEASLRFGWDIVPRRGLRDFGHESGKPRSAVPPAVPEANGAFLLLFEMAKSHHSRSDV